MGQICAKCGAGGAEVEASVEGSAPVWLHRACEEDWLVAHPQDDLTIPAAMRRCPDDEVWKRLLDESPTQGAVRSPAISSGPDDDLDDFKIN
jgi:hypothetical protein